MQASTRRGSRLLPGFRRPGIPLEHQRHVGPLDAHRWFSPVESGAHHEFLGARSQPGRAVHDAGAERTATAAVTEETPRFDTTVSSAQGDEWQALTSSSAPAYRGLEIAQGGAGTINLTFSPPAGTPAGTVVSGVLNVESTDDTLDESNVLARIPYEYAVGSSSTVPARPVLISALRLIGPGGAGDRYVQLTNVAGTSVSLSGWALKVADQNTTTTIPLSGSIAARGSLIVGDTGSRNPASRLL